MPMNTFYMRAEWVRGAAGRTHHDGRGELAAGHVAYFRGAVEYLVEREPGEVHRHDLDDGPHAEKGGADAEAGVAVFRDGGVDHAIVIVFVGRARRGGGGAADHADVLAHADHERIARHLFVVRAADRFPINHDCHFCTPPRT